MKLTPRVLRLTPAVLTGTVICFSIASDTPIDSFKRLHGDWKSALMGENKALRESYAKRLTVLETGSIDSGDYASADRARKERLKISGEGPASEISYGSLAAPQEQDQAVMVDMSRALLTGGVAISGETSALASSNTP